MYIKLVNNTVVQKQPNQQEGFIFAPDDVVCGMMWDGIGYIAPSKPLADVKADRIQYINDQADIAFNAITASYPKQEVSTWPNQYAEAWALQADPSAYTPTLNAIALESGVAVPLLATSVLQKAAAYTQASGLIVGKRKRLTDEINASVNPESISW